MITKLYTTHVVVYVQILTKLPVVFVEIRPPKPKKIKLNLCTFSVRFRFGFGFGAYVKALIGGLRHFIFSVRFWFGFGSVSVCIRNGLNCLSKLCCLFKIRIQKRRRHLFPHPIHGNQNLSLRHLYHLMSYISHRHSLIENMSSGHCAHLSSSHLFINKEKVSIFEPI